jgi:hypothetical protein
MTKEDEEKLFCAATVPIRHHFYTNTVSISFPLLLHCEHPGKNSKEENGKNGIMTDHWRLVIITVGCAIALALQLGSSRNIYSRLGGTGGGGE